MGEELTSFKIPKPDNSDPPDINSLLFEKMSGKRKCGKSYNKNKENKKPKHQASEGILVSKDILVSEENLLIENSSSKGKKNLYLLKNVYIQYVFLQH